MMPRGRNDAGFSLIEALVALAVLAIATVGLVGAMEQHIDSTRAMERRSAAMWVAENRMAELGIGAPGGERVTMLDTNWQVRTARSATDDPEIAKVRVAVFEEGAKSPTATLDGFLDQPRPEEPRR
ncbi:type II secretion system minor pseudopilin GspI [Sphingomonas donggukensis]|uniref:Type II secretion system protein I n=1 Tax=Sphingomonas donggukensis TaxID=2949093 RepID=A0ABY4TQD5_9SPHN|nr:type II secretion system minor pseudopilin GspI [Sphingomonas donggukensis]URW74585.1 type II secretion system minor pseudopilin GspI [Sphingomonas donggukensis]